MLLSEAAFIHRVNASDNGKDYLECTLCPHKCHIFDSSCGFCGVRCNTEGKVILPFYGAVSALAVDPIEKKPLYHFRPGSEVFSVGFFSCNLRCPFCQNWQISQVPKAIVSDINKVMPDKLVKMVKEHDCDAIAFTYSEPLIHYEYLLDCLKLCKEKHIASIIVTNGSILPPAASELLSLCTAVNVDIKTFLSSSYTNILKGNLQTVLDFVSLAVRCGVHTEITTLVIPDFNDSMDELVKCRNFIADLSPSIPWHLSAYHPAYTWNRKATSADLLMSIANMALERLQFVYTGNIAGERNHTYCSSCKALLVSRNGYRIDISGLVSKKSTNRTDYYCLQCGAPTPFNAGNV